jgi:hypothetical protein
MSQIRFRQLARLEKWAKPHIEQKRKLNVNRHLMLWGAVGHASILAFLIRCGNPKIDEPLSCACQRFSESDTWKACCEMFPQFLSGRPDERSFKPYNRDRVIIIGWILRHVILCNFPKDDGYLGIDSFPGVDSFPGIDEKERLDAVFGSAPPWLIWFTFGDYTAKLLGLRLPDLSSMIGFERSEETFRCWWGLPEGQFEPHPWPDGPDNEPLAETDLNLLRPEPSPEKNMTPRERKRPSKNRTDDWPFLPEPMMMEIDFKSRFPKLGRRRLIGKHPTHFNELPLPKMRR